MYYYKFIKILNNTEIGGTNTNDTYIYLQQQYQDLFSMHEYNNELRFQDKETNQIIIIKPTKAKECRITKMGAYWRLKNAVAGDKVIIERVERNGVKYNYISLEKNSDLFYLEYFKKNNCFIPWGQDEFLDFYNINNIGSKSRIQECEIEYIGKIIKRADSKTEYSAIKLSNNKITNKIIAINKKNNKIEKEPILWTKIKLEYNNKEK